MIESMPHTSTKRDAHTRRGEFEDCCSSGPARRGGLPISPGIPARPRRGKRKEPDYISKYCSNVRRENCNERRVPLWAAPRVTGARER